MRSVSLREVEILLGDRMVGMLMFVYSHPICEHGFEKYTLVEQEREKKLHCI